MVLLLWGGLHAAKYILVNKLDANEKPTYTKSKTVVELGVCTAGRNPSFTTNTVKGECRALFSDGSRGNVPNPSMIGDEWVYEEYEINNHWSKWVRK